MAAGLSRGSGQQHKAPHGRCSTVPSAEAAALTLHHVNTLHGTLQPHPSEGIIPAFWGPLLAVGMVLAMNKNNLPPELCLKAVGLTLWLGCFPANPEHHPTPCGRGAGGRCTAFCALCFTVPGCRRDAAPPAASKGVAEGHPGSTALPGLPVLPKPTPSTLRIRRSLQPPKRWEPAGSEGAALQPPPPSFP